METHRSRQPYGSVKQAVLQAEAQGLSVREAAQAFGLTPRSVRSAAQHAQVTLRRERRPLGSVKDMVMAGVAQGLTVPQMAETTGVPMYTLYATARRLGLTPCKARRGRLPR